jgi:hypothetical protein
MLRIDKNTITSLLCCSEKHRIPNELRTHRKQLRRRRKMRRRRVKSIEEWKT